MTKFENLTEAWNAFMRQDTPESTTAWRRAADLATKRDLINLASNLAGMVFALREVSELKKATDARLKSNAYPPVPAAQRQEVQSC